MEQSDFAKLKPMPLSRISQGRPVIVAHRGASAIAPENTLPAFEAALRDGADGIEFDVQRTTDGHLIVFHDEDIARTTDGTGKIPQMTLAEVQKLDAGIKFDDRFRGTRVSRLAELFDWIQGNDLLMFMEMKEPFRFPGIEQEIVDLIRQYKLVDRIQIRCFFHLHLHEVNRIAPEIALSELWYQHLPQEGEFKYPTLNLQHDYYTPEVIANFHAIQRKVTAWVVDDLDIARNLISWGIDGLTTNDPAKIVTLFTPDGK